MGLSTKLTLFERRLRIVTGLILSVYIIVHLSNHALGLISLDAMESMRKGITPFWRSWFGGLLIYGSLLSHFVLALMSLYRRTSLRMPAWEFCQLALGLSIVPLLAGHVSATWGGRVLMGFDPNYTLALTAILSDPWVMTRQFFLVIVAWAHVVIGLHFFFRLYPGYRHRAIHFYPFVFLLPLLVMFSLGRVGMDLGVWKATPEDTDKVIIELQDFDEPAVEKYVGAEPAYIKGTAPNKLLHDGILIIFFSLLGLTLLSRWVRGRHQQTMGKIVISHINGRELKGATGQTILEIVRSHSIPHASLCGGRGRCTTCRVRVGRGSQHLPKPSALEQFALNRIGAAPNVRLACQTRPNYPIQITPLVPATLGIENSLRSEER